MIRATNILLILALAALTAPDPVRAEGGWPFGEGGGMFSRGKDDYNLGLMGAKARDADAEPPPEEWRGGTRRVNAGRAPTRDNGPDRLLVEILYPGGPAETGGLRIGDVIVGVSGRRFKDGCLDQLARALLKAESGKGKIELTVEREGEKRALELALEIPVGGRPAAKPTIGKGRVAIVEKALAWLAGRQDDDGGFRQTLSGTNGAVVQTSVAGLAWLAGSDAKEGPYADDLSSAATFVAANAGKTFAMPGGARGGGRMPGLDQTNWGYAYAAIFLGEYLARRDDRDVRRALRECGQALAERQEESGGWAHGPGGPNPLGYLELNIVSGLALCGMGMARRTGWTPPPGAIDRAEAYLKASGGGDGGIGYSDSPGQRGMGNIGRTAISWLGAELLGLGRRPFTKKMRRWTESHIDDFSGAHASWMQHVLHAGVAANALGKSARKAYWAKMERDLILARAPDGSLQPRPWHESLSMQSNSDVTFGEVWTTAVWAIVLAGPVDEDGLPGLPVWQGQEKKGRR